MREDVVTYLIEVKALIRKGWAKGQPSRDKAGKFVNWSCDDATNFSLLGAMFRAQTNRDVYLTTKRTIEAYLYPDTDFEDPYRAHNLASWNDTRTGKHQVLLMLDQVIAEVLK